MLAFAARAADELGENEGYVPDEIVAEGLALVDESDRRQIVSCFLAAVNEEWSGDLDEREARELVGAAIRGAICDRRPVARTQLLILEVEDDLPREVGVRLAVVLPTGALWSFRDAEAVLPKLPEGFLWKRMWEPAEGPLLEVVEDWHVDRLRLLCAALLRHLPLPSLPRASRIVAADCRAVLADDDQARRVAAALLLSHASWLAAGRTAVPSFN